MAYDVSVYTLICMVATSNVTYFRVLSLAGCNNEITLLIIFTLSGCVVFPETWVALLGEKHVGLRMNVSKKVKL